MEAGGADVVRTNGVIGGSPVRVDGVAKVTGLAMYGADQGVPGAAYAWLVTAAIARGKVKAIDEAAARAMPGVLDVLTHDNVGGAVKAGKPMVEGGYMAHAVAPL